MGLLGILLLLLDFLHSDSCLCDLILPLFRLRWVMEERYGETLLGGEADLSLVAATNTDDLGVDGAGNAVENFHVELR